MKFLAVDTSGRQLNTAVFDGAREHVFSRKDCAMQHSVLLMGEIAEALHAAALSPVDCDFFACVAGPGSFTGIRIGVTTANALKRAVNARLAAFTSLEALAFDETRVLALMDCKHSNYYALLKDGGEESYFAASSDELDRDFPDLKRIYYSAPDAEKYIKCFLAKCEKGDFVRIACPFYIKKSSAEA